MKNAFTLFIVAFILSGMVHAQDKTTLSVKDLNSGITKYVRKNFKDYKIVEAYNYPLVFVMTLHKGEMSEKLVFDREGEFVKIATEDDKAKVALQTRSTLSLKDVESDITKYLKKNYKESKLTEAFMFDEVYKVKVMKGEEAATLLFDKEGKFIKQVTAPSPAELPKKSDSVPVKPVSKEVPKTADTSKK